MSDQNRENEPREVDDTGPALPQTERGEKREKEDRDYLPVIVKRSDEARRHPDDTLEIAIHVGIEQLNRHFLSLIIASIAAGMILGFTAMAAAVVQTVAPQFATPGLERILTALVYPVGFIICIMSGTELFTEHTATAAYPVLDRRAPVWRLFWLWGVVLTGNLIGAWIVSRLLLMANDVVGATEGFIKLGHHLTGFDNGSLFISAVLAGWLMAQGGWLTLSTPPTGSQIACIYLVTFTIGLGGLHHSIAGAVEIFAAQGVSPDIGPRECLRFISLAVLGNLVGGSGFVALLNYGQVRETQKSWNQKHKLEAGAAVNVRGDNRDG